MKIKSDLSVTTLCTLGMLILASTLGIGARAEEPKNERQIVEPDSYIVRGSSAHMRMGKNFELDAILLGVGPNLVSTSGLIGAFYLDPYNQLLLEFTSGQTSSGFFGTDYTQSGTSVGFHYKHFTGNSFYFRTGVDYRMFKSSYTYNDLFGSGDATRRFDGQSVALNFQIGNQWQWETFTIGCDWIGVSAPITSSVSNEYVNSSDLTYDRSQLKNDENTYVKNTNVTLLRLYVGASF